MCCGGNSAPKFISASGSKSPKRVITNLPKSVRDQTEVARKLKHQRTLKNDLNKYRN